MAEFKAGFVDTPEIIEASAFRAGPIRKALSMIAFQGYDLELGLPRKDRSQITHIAQQRGVREFCPRDIAERFGDDAQTEHTLTKDGGALFFTLRNKGMGRVDAYGWTRLKEEAHLPHCETTSAYRLSKEITGKGLGAAFVRAVVDVSSQRGLDKIGLETWSTNGAAVGAYLAAGATLAWTEEGTRPTLDEDKQVLPDGRRQDARLFMQFAHTLGGPLMPRF